LAEAAQGSGYPVSIKVYPGAFHSFGSSVPVRFDPRRTNSSALSGHGATTGGDATAWADAKLRSRCSLAATSGPHCARV